MSESKELKVGDTVTLTIDDKLITLKPVTLGKMKKAVESFQKKDGDTFEMMQEYLYQILNNGQNPFATPEWISDHITMPVASKIVDDMRTINGMGDNNFFRTGGAAKQIEPRETRDLAEATPTPSA